MKKIELDGIIMYLISIFPITTIIQGIPILGNINRVMMLALLMFMLISILKKKIKKDNIIIIFITFFLYIFAFINTNKNLNLNFNIYVYFLFWVIFFIYIKDNYIYLTNFIKRKQLFFYRIINIWCIIVLISLGFKFSYNQDGFFSPFGCGEHRFGSCCVMITAYIYTLIQLSDKKYLWFYFIIPILGIGMSGARTYLVIYIILMFCIFYKKYNKKYIFYLSIIPAVIIIFLLIKNSPVGYKFVNTYQNGYNGLLATFTSGRSNFWKYDIDAFNQLSFIKKMMGNGFDFVYYINMKTINLAIWAHNDFINILLNFGLIGLSIYLYVFLTFLKEFYKYYSVNKIYRFSMIFIWLFNAIFNMVYTYVIATLSIPFILFMLCEKNKKGLLNNEGK